MGKELDAPSFYAALEAAGLGGRPIAWGSDGQLSLGAELTDEERQKVLDVYKAYVKPEAPPEQ